MAFETKTVGRDRDRGRGRGKGRARDRDGGREVDTRRVRNVPSGSSELSLLPTYHTRQYEVKDWWDI